MATNKKPTADTLKSVTTTNQYIPSTSVSADQSTLDNSDDATRQTTVAHPDNRTQPKMPAVPGAVETITMDDGTLVEFGGKRQMLKSAETVTVKNPDGTETETARLRFDFRTGRSSFYTISTELMLRMAIHGASQKIGDSAAACKDVNDMQLAVDTMIDQLNNGKWESARKSGPTAGGSLLFLAIQRAFPGKTSEAIRAWLENCSTAQRGELTRHPKIKDHFEAVQAERAARKPKPAVDVSALLEQFGE